MLTHHEPNICDIDFASLSHEQRSQIIQKVIRRAHIERAKVMSDLVGRLFGAIALRGHAPSRTAAARRDGTPPNCATEA